jgi:predicted DNA-binding transcriptional regulator YafY
MTIANELRAECAKIIARNFGLPNELAAIRISTVQKIDAYVEDAEDRIARCTCDHAPGFELKDTDTPAYAAMRQAGIDRMLERAGL